MSETIFVAALYNGRANLLKVPIEKETPKIFFFGQEPIIHIIGHDVPQYLYNKQVHKRNCAWWRTADGALRGLRNMTKENMKMKKSALRQAESELEYVERFRLPKEEQDNGTL